MLQRVVVLVLTVGVALACWTLAAAERRERACTQARDTTVLAEKAFGRSLSASAASVRGCGGART